MPDRQPSQPYDSTPVPVHRADLLKIRDAVVSAENHHVARDESNAHLHLARETRLSPLTSELVASRERLDELVRKPTDA